MFSALVISGQLSFESISVCVRVCVYLCFCRAYTATLANFESKRKRW